MSMMKEVMKKRTRQKNVEEEIREQFSGEEQELLMPGLRHAHTLQQLRIIDEYSPPGEYLINNITTTSLLVLLK